MSTMREAYVTREGWVARGSGAGPWPVYWTAVWVGALAGVALALLLGLLGVAVGAHVGIRQSAQDASTVSMIVSVLGAFLAFAAAGWVCGKMIGRGESEIAILHAAVAWLVAVPILVVLATLGGGALFGPWYGGLAGTPTWVAVASDSVSSVTPRASPRRAASRGPARMRVRGSGARAGGWRCRGW
jgi:hypothetical protein